MAGRSRFNFNGDVTFHPHATVVKADVKQFMTRQFHKLYRFVTAGRVRTRTVYDLTRHIAEWRPGDAAKANQVAVF